MTNFSEEFSIITEYGWNERADNVTPLRSGGYRLDGSKTKARVVLNAQPIINKAFVFELKGAPAIDPAFDKGIWFMFADANGLETGAELDALEFLTQPSNRGHQGTITYRSSQYHADGTRNLGFTDVFDAGKFDHYRVEVGILPAQDRQQMTYTVAVYGKLQSEVAWFPLITRVETVKRATHANLKVGSFLIGETFAFKRVADRGPMFIDFTRYHVATIS